MNPIIPSIRACGAALLCALFSASSLFVYDLHAQTLSPSDLLSPVPLDKLTYGFNGEYMSDECYTSDEPVQIPPVPFNDIYLDQTCPELIAEVDPGVIRWPGGITANFYHFYGTGYGINRLETIGSAIGPVNPAEDELVPENFIVTFADMVLQTNSKVIYTINPYTHFKAGGSALNDITSTAYQYRFQENLDALQYLHDRGVDVIAVEMGNEMYYYPELTSIFAFSTQIDLYLDISEQYTDSIKNRWPDIKVAVPVAIHNGYGNIGWNNKMAEADFADGVSIHEYERIVYNNCGGINTREEYFQCAKANIERFFDTDFEAAMTEYMDLYPGKELWLTEWGMSQSHKVGNTFFDAYFVFKYWNMIADMQKRYPGAIPYALRHLLIGSGYSNSAYGLKFFDESDDLFYNGNKAKHANAYSHQLMGPLFNNNHSFIGATSLDGHDAWLYRHNNGTYKLAIVNEAHTDVSFNLTGLSQQTGEQGLAFKTHHYLTANDYSTPAGINHFKIGYPNYTNMLDYHPDTDVSGQNTVTLKGISLNVFEIVQTEEAVFALNSFEVSETDCTIQASWSVQNETAGYQYIVYENGEARDTVEVSQNAASNNHQVTWSADMTGTNIYNLEIFEAQTLLTTSESQTISVDCAPVIPDPSLDAIQVSEENCVLSISWTILDDQIDHSITLTITTDGQPQWSETINSNSSGTYSTSFTPAQNGNHEIAIALSNPNGSVIDEVQSLLPVTCIPDPDPEITAWTTAVNEFCELVDQWQIANAYEGLKLVRLVLNDAQVIVDSDTIEIDAGPEFQTAYLPEDNGTYHTSIRILNQLEVISETSKSLNEVSCIIPPASISTASMITNADCALQINWAVENEESTHSYRLELFDGSDVLISSQLVHSNGLATYEIIYDPTANDVYSAEITITQDGSDQLTSDRLTAEVDCIGPPPASSSDLYAELSSDCQFELQWQVTNETPASIYVIWRSLNEEYFEVIDTVFSITTSENQIYSYFVSPEENGSYRFQMVHTIDGIFSDFSVTAPEEVSCVPPPDPELAAVLMEEIDCALHLSWQVTHDRDDLFSKVYHSIDDPYLEPAFNVLADGNGTYEAVIPIESNGTHRASIELRDATTTYAVSDELTLEIDCITPPPEPSIGLMIAFPLSDCKYSLYWSVLDESASSAYTIMVSTDGGPFEAVSSLWSNGNMPITVYNHIFEATENGSHKFRIDRYQDNVLAESSNVVNRVVNCVPDPVPGFIDFKVIRGSSCTYDLEWQVVNETANASYEVLVSMNGDPFTVLDEQTAQQTDDLALYTYAFNPGLNGYYRFKVHRLENQQFESATNIVSKSIDCIEDIGALITSTDVAMVEPCAIELSWTVDNENEMGTYMISATVDDGEVMTLASLPSAAGQEAYTVDLVPEVNGIYAIELIRTQPGLPDIAVQLYELEINCIEIPDPIFEDFDVSVDESCVADISWTISQENPSSSYRVNVSYEGGTFETVHQIQSTDASPLAEYHFMFNPPHNGVYTWHIERYQDNSYAATSSSLSRYVFCQDNETTLLGPLEFEVDGNCAIDLAWNVLNETSDASYILYKAVDGGNYMPVFTSNTVPSGNYQYQFIPSEDGVHNFYIERYLNGELDQTNEPVRIMVDCVNPAVADVSSFQALPQENCIVDFNWTIDNVHDGLSHQLLAKRNNLEAHVLTEIEEHTSSNQSIHAWTEQFTKPGLYQFYVELYDQSGPVSTSEVITETITCAANNLRMRISRGVTNGQFDVFIQANNEIPVDIQLIRTNDADIVHHQSITLTYGNNHLTYDFRSLTNIQGSYQLLIRSDNQVESESVIYVE